jgi:outer membrane protein OmpA-like peptidoglycan-associated protein
MAKIKAMTAEAKSRKAGALTELQDVQKELSDYQSALAIFKQKLAEGEKAKEAQAKAEAERKELKEAKRKAVEMEAQKRKELEEAQKKVAEIEALKQKELQEARLKEAQRAGEREKELGEAKLKAERLAMQHGKEEAEMKAREEQLAAEKQKLAALQKKAEALEREKAMLVEASRIPNVTVKSADKEMVITILAIHLFTPANDLKSSGKTILDRLGKFLKSYSNNQVVVRGHTDSVGKETTNQAISEKRSQRVREYLVAYQDIPSTRITAIGLGPSQPVASNSTEAGRTLNRRVEIAIIPKD